MARITPLLVRTALSVPGYRMFTPDQQHARGDFTRLGYIVFNPASNAVEHNFWTCNQADFPKPVKSGDVYYCGQWSPGTNPRNNCAINTAPGFIRQLRACGIAVSRLCGKCV
jgi:hypothetical protein